MPREELAGDGFESRRRKEELAFLAVKFLRAYLRFQEIAAGFRQSVADNRLAGSGLFERVRDLADGLAFDIKEKTHYLFRTVSRQANGSRAAAARPGAVATDARVIDSYIGTGYHVLLILRESLYQIERYAPGLDGEADTGRELASETETLASRMVERCEELFQTSADVLRRFMASGGENEILVLNLLQNADLLERVYGEGSAEAIFSDVCRGRRLAGRTGTEKALNYVKARCGNITGLPAQPA